MPAFRVSAQSLRLYHSEIRRASRKPRPLTPALKVIAEPGRSRAGRAHRVMTAAHSSGSDKLVFGTR